MGLTSSCASAVTAGVLVLMITSGCATGHMWHAMTMGESNKGTMYYEPETPASWAEYVGAVLLVPVTVAIDIVFFLVQVVGGYWPYGDKDAP